MQDLTGPRKHFGAEQREKILQSYRESSLTQKEFAVQAGVSLSTLQAWLRKASEARGPSPGFVAVPNLLAARPAPAAYRLQWPDGLTLEVRSGFAAQELAVLLQLLPPL
ncbi:MAG TPA: transposase [Verrucomicrobiae bacterium]|jgi:transposase-like protein|nr:transposase [Verrucomicrobiae bacterium]